MPHMSNDVFTATHTSSNNEQITGPDMEKKWALILVVRMGQIVNMFLQLLTITKDFQ